MTEQTRTFRPLSLRASTANETNHTVEAVLSSEQRTTVFDRESWGLIDEVALMSGVMFREQLPLLDSHDRSSTDKIRGSVRGMRVQDTRLLGILYFASDADSERAWQLVRQGHLTDVSIGYAVTEYTDIPAGRKATVGGVEYAAGPDRPLRVTTRWEPRELSLVPIGADANAKIREQHEQQTALGDGASMLEQHEKDEVTRSERARVLKLRELAKAGDVPDELLDTAIEQGWDEPRAAGAFYAHVVKEREAKSPVIGHEIRVGESGKERTLRALTDALLGRTDALNNHVPCKERREAMDAFPALSLRQVAIDCARLDGVRDAEHLSPTQLFERSISTGSFPELLDNTVGKSLQTAYSEAPGTFRIWCGRRSVKDFKDYKDLVLSEFSSIKQVGRGGEIEHLDLTEKHEHYAIKTYGGQFALTRQDFINDDLGAFLRIPTMLGKAAARNIESVGLSLFVSNAGVGPTMAEDSKALFDATRTTKNYVVGATYVLSDAGLAEGRRVMRLIEGAGGVQLALRPKYLLVPAALENTGAKFMASTELQATADASDKMPNVNPHRNLAALLVEPGLDATSTTAYYLIASAAEQESVVLVFLNGNEVPVVERHDPHDVLGIGWWMYHDMGAAALDWRGAVRMKGAD